jgi:hypothetical protein
MRQWSVWQLPCKSNLLTGFIAPVIRSARFEHIILAPDYRWRGRFADLERETISALDLSRKGNQILGIERVQRFYVANCGRRQMYRVVGLLQLRMTSQQPASQHANRVIHLHLYNEWLLQVTLKCCVFLFRQPFKLAATLELVDFRERQRGCPNFKIDVPGLLYDRFTPINATLLFGDKRDPDARIPIESLDISQGRRP